MTGGKRILCSIFDNRVCHFRNKSTPIIEKIKNLIQIESDIHLEKKFPRKLNPTKPFLLLAGDIGYPFEKEYCDFVISSSFYFQKVFVLSGNHEYDFLFHDKINGIKNTEDRIKDICSTRNNIFYLQKDTHTLCKDNNIILAGCTLWSPFPLSTNKYHLDHHQWLKNTLEDNPKNNYIVATHHCPLLECLNKKYNYKNINYFASDQSELIQKNNLICWIHGHSHYNRNINTYGKWILTNQYGSFRDPLWGYKS